MQKIFYNMVDISVAAVWLILAVIILRAIFQKAPKFVRNIMWLLVAVRLIFPFKIESKIGVVPQIDIESIEVPKVNITDNVPQPIPPTPPDSVVNSINISDILCIVWLVGIAAMLIYLIVSYLRLKRKVDISITLDSRYRICDSIQTPFIFGIINPKVYLPSIIEGEQLKFVIDHEDSHLKHLDHIWKLLGFVLLAVYWFNPFVWLAYFLFCKDIELACDERVIRGRDAEYKKLYSAALLVCSTSYKEFSACPVAFGEISVKSRIANVVKYKKPAVILVAVSVIATISLLFLFLRAPLVLAENHTVIPNNTNNNGSNSSGASVPSENETDEPDDTVSQSGPSSIIIDTPTVEEKCTHTYKNTKIAGNCFTEGYTIHECTKCGFIYMDEYNGGRHDYGKYNCLVCGMADPKNALYGFRGWVKEYGQESGNFYVYNVGQGNEIYGVQRHQTIEEYCVLTYDNAAEQEHIYITFYDTSYCNVYYEWGKYSGFAEVKNSGVNSSTGIVFDDFTGDDAARTEFTNRYQSIIDNVMKNIEEKIVKSKIGITLNLLGFSKY
ncbi:MAG: hypothetical protein IJF35_03485 [Clostridia bacterium]|nr:hypothetical protein [Clostridia bacterium]